MTAALLIAPALAFMAVQDRGPAVAESAPTQVAVVPAIAPAVAAERTAAVTALSADLQRLLTNSGLNGAQWSVLVVSLDKGDTLFAYDADSKLAPASGLKLFTTAAALYYLGPDFRYSTFLLADGKIENGVLNGDLVVYGTGDPTFTARFGRRDAVWHAFADTLAALGVREVRGNIIGDASYFAGPGTGTGWQEDYIGASYAAPSSALSFGENIATLEIKPRAVGEPPFVGVADGADEISVVNNARTVARGRSFIHVTRTSYDSPLEVRGQISRGTVSIQRTVPVADPAEYAVSVFKQVLIDKGIAVGGQTSSVTEAAQSPVTGRMVFAPALDNKQPVRVLAIYQSRPLIDVLEIVNKKSHNLMAEQTLRTVGRVALGEGSVAAGEKAVVQLLMKETGATPEGFRMDDGSGLSVLDRASSRNFIQLLSFMAKSPMFDSYWQTLPEAGVAGGLRRMGGTAAAGNLRAKTGTIDNVSSLSGYVRSQNGERLAFSIIANNVPSTWRAKRIEDAIGIRLASFDRNNDRPMNVSVSKATPSRASGRAVTIRRGDTLQKIARRNGTTVAALQR
ncbi:MAG TPA: D-alanyl-D-alanine carboxypeptidase/D-alanyl-D-alanine-endopeptidase, partial [Longimicrobiales bacterium]|nr:D-alanyl-D-alanine carboxypeptidase/D-alanyl-D-alanine-endopeptidase [Longimicrobiales bacterium]